ncbi:MAG: hypothetical protein ABSG86_31560 [Thermoguttaceae bacterium]|jgi:hypothetical protein
MEYNRAWKRRYDRLVEQHGEPLPHHASVDLYEGVREDSRQTWLAVGAMPFRAAR